MYIRQITIYKTPRIIQLLIFSHLVKILNAFFVTKKFIILSTKADHLCLF